MVKAVWLWLGNKTYHSPVSPILVPISLAWPTHPEPPNFCSDRQASAEFHPLALLMTTELSQGEPQTQKSCASNQGNDLPFGGQGSCRTSSEQYCYCPRSDLSRCPLGEQALCSRTMLVVTWYNTPQSYQQNFLG